MGYSQATMSLRLQALEDKLGVRLLDRGPRDVRLTAAGRSLFPEIQTLVDMHDKLVGRLLTSPVVDATRIGVAEGCVASFLPRFMRELSNGRPQAQVDILCRTSSCLQQMVEARSLDLAVLILPAGKRSDLDLCRLELQWVASPEFTLDLQEPVPLVWHKKDTCFRVSGIAALESRRIAYRELLVGSDERVVQAAVEAGTAVTVMAEGNIPASLAPVNPQAGLPEPGGASVRLMESPGTQSEAGEAVKRMILEACRDAEPAAS